jgi:transposase
MPWFWLNCSAAIIFPASGIPIPKPSSPAARPRLQSSSLAHIEGELEIFNRELAAHPYQSDTVKLLMTLPGVDVAVAETLLPALGDISRFPNADKAAAYLGLVPPST